MPATFLGSVTVNFTDSDFNAVPSTINNYIFLCQTDEILIEDIDYTTVQVARIQNNSDITFNNLSASFNGTTHTFAVSGRSTSAGSGSMIVYFYYSKTGPESEEISKRLLQGDKIVYPFTKQENIIGLQKTITDKLPIVSEDVPQTGYVPKQVWLNLDDGNIRLTDNRNSNFNLTDNAQITEPWVLPGNNNEN